MDNARLRGVSVKLQTSFFHNKKSFWRIVVYFPVKRLPNFAVNE